MSPLKRMPDGFFDRGSEVTRLEAFVDATFAFTLSILVIGGNDMPTSIAALLASMKKIPAFAASFMLLIQFWRAHASWSRRFGLDDARSQNLSLLLIFLVLIFVYPLQMVFASFFALLSNGALPHGFVINDMQSLRVLFACFALAFASMACVIVLLYRHALQHAAQIGLDTFELTAARMILRDWQVVILVCLLSLILTATLPEQLKNTVWIGLPGYVFFLLNLNSFWTQRKLSQLAQTLPRASPPAE